MSGSARKQAKAFIWRLLGVGLLPADMMLKEKNSICHIVHHPSKFSSRSGMLPLAEAIGADTVSYDARWRQVRDKSWLSGYIMRALGNWYYGSIYNDILPFVDEWRLHRDVCSNEYRVVHFIWSEFASPSIKRWFCQKNGILVGTYHSSYNRLNRVCKHKRIMNSYDGIMLMSETQIPFFIQAGYPANRLRVVRHGVDIDYFRPDYAVLRNETEALRLLLVGTTERDNQFAAAVMRTLGSDAIKLFVRTSDVYEGCYRELNNVVLLPRLSDSELLEQYQQADLLFMPMLACTANNVILEAMACGTPVMVNRVGGIPEYVEPTCNYVMEEKNVDLWCRKLRWLAENREELHAQRKSVRDWAERFSWQKAGDELLDFYETLS